MTQQAKFEKLRAAYIALDEKTDAIRLEYRIKYGNDWRSCLTRAQTKKLDALHERKDRISDQFFVLLDSISPRNWRSTIAFGWVITKLSYADAITKERLSVLPEPAYGSTVGDVQRFALACGRDN